MSLVLHPNPKIPVMKNIYLTLLSLATFFYATSSPSETSTAEIAQIRSNLYIVSPTGSTTLMDGNLTQFGPDYSNDLDGKDARKMSNFSENWGMLRNNTVYVIERRHTISGTDSIFFKMWNMRVIKYRIEFITSNLDFPGRTAVLEDKYLNTKTPIDLNGTSYVDFSVTADPGSKATDRFRLIFSNEEINGFKPLEFGFVNLVNRNSSVLVSWEAANAGDMGDFTIEKSVDGIHFTRAGAVKPHAQSLQYQFPDNNPVDGDNYYRVSKSNDAGKTIYSNIVKIAFNKNGDFKIYPNPVNISNFNLQFTNQLPGGYKIKLLNSFGQVFYSKELQLTGGNGIQKLLPPQNIPSGIYQLEIVSPDGARKVISVVL